VVKPHEETPIMGGTMIGKIFEEAGLPSGLLNVVVTDIRQIGDAFIEHPIPRVLAFTGSTAVGRHVAEVGARHFKKVLLELGGNSAFIVLDDADLEYAVDAAVFSRFTHQGQICMSANRVLVHQDVFKDFTERYIAKVSTLKVGDPRAEDTILGPLITAKQAENLNAVVDQAIADGATPVLRGKVDGTMFEPVVLLDVKPDMDVAQRELFGPVVSLIPFKDDDEAVEIANNTQFGLSGAVHTGDLDRGVALAKRVQTGMIHVNDCTIHDEPIVAFGGEKQSGLGRLNGPWSLDEFTTMKWVSVNHGRRQFPY
jgi:vanillin dehydrogenase